MAMISYPRCLSPTRRFLLRSFLVLIAVVTLVAGIEPVLADTVPIGPNQKIDRKIDVPAASDSLSVSTRWQEGNDVATSLISPSGRAIVRSTVASDVYHQLGPVSEVYVISNPEAGTWTASLFGKNVTNGTVAVGFSAKPLSHQHLPPIARANAYPTAGPPPLTVSLSAANSAAREGSIASYSWKFADGTTGSGVEVSHVYTTPGRYVPLLTVTDSGGVTTSTATSPILVGAAGAVSPAFVDFGEVPLDSTSTSHSFTVTSTGTGALAVAGLDPGGTNAAEVRIVSDHCTGASLPPGASCSFDLALAPKAMGLRGALLTIRSNGTIEAGVLLGAKGTSRAPIPRTYLLAGGLTILVLLTAVSGLFFLIRRRRRSTRRRSGQP